MRQRISIILLSLVAWVTFAPNSSFAQGRATGENNTHVISAQTTATQIASKPAKTSLLTTRPMGSATTKKQSTPGSLLRSVAATAPTLYGSVIYADSWTSDNAPYGIYSFPANSNTTFTAVHLGNNFEANGGGTYINGKYCFINYFDFNGQTYINYYVYDTETWDLVNAIQSLPTSAIASDMSYDPVTKQIYGCFQNADGNGFQFASMNPETAVVTPIAKLQQMMYALAINSKGEVYSVGADGNFYQIDKSNGSATKIGSTGITPQYVQSAAFDLQTDKLYWAASLSNGTAGVYEINVSTGRATLISSCPNNEEVCGLYIPAPLANADAPAKVSNLALDFANGATSGKVTFTLPSKTFGGENLSGTLSYSILCNEEVVASGSAMKGSNVSKEITVEPGMCTIAVYASNSAGNGPTSEMKQWIGPDVPAAVTNLRLRKSGKAALNLSWTAPTTGLHNGYFDASQVTYKIVRQPEGVTVATNATGTSFTDNISSDVLRNYYYEVTGCVGNLEGETAVSNKIDMGTACEVPYFEDFLTVDDFEMYTVVNSNVDDYTWTYDEEIHAAKCKSDTYEQMNDWLISPLITLGTDHVYKLSFKAFCASSKFPETLKVALGTSKSTSAMTTELIPATIVGTSQGEILEAIIKVPTAGNYCIGFQSLSLNQFNLYVDSISVETNALRSAPAAVSNLTITPAAKGALKTTIAFTSPSKTIDGASTSLTKVEIYRDGTLIKTFNSPATNTQLSYTDEVAKQGYNNYMVVAHNASGAGIETKQKTYVGIDIPDKPLNVKLKDIDGKNVLTWEAPTAGMTGGYIDPATLTYTVQRSIGNTIVAQDIKGLTFTEELKVNGGGQILMSYYVWAKSEAGEGMYEESNAIIIGDPYSLKFKESFTGMGIDNSPWGLENYGNSYWNTTDIGSFVLATPQDNDGGFATFSNNGGSSQLVSPKITLQNSVRPTLDFYYYACNGSSNVLKVEVSKEGGEYEVVHTINCANDTQEGWTKVSVPLTQYNTAKYIQLSFHAFADGGMNLHIDNIVVRDLLDYNLSIKEISAPKRLIFGANNNIQVTILNEGTKSATDYTVDLYRNGKKVASQAGTTLAADAEKTYTFVEVPTLDSQESVTYYAIIEYAADLKTNDNQSQEITVSVQLPKYPKVNDLKGSCKNGKTVELSWTAPDLTSALSGEITDGFEDYNPFIVTNIGSWELFDGDGESTYGINAGGGILQYDNATAPMAFQVFNASAVGLTGTEWAPYSGDQCLVSFSAVGKQCDDWLISPELTGKAQTLSFYVKKASPLYPDSYEILTSTTNSELSSFSVITTNTEITNAWEHMSVNLPAGTKYFAIRNISNDCYALLFDDICYASKEESMEGLALTGYNIYRNGVKLNATPVTATSYQENVADGKYTYQVSVVYNLGESVYSNPVEIQASSAIEDNLADVLRVYSANSAIRVEHAPHQMIQVYTFDGKLIYQGVGEEYTTISVNAGQYLVKVAHLTFKVLVK